MTQFMYCYVESQNGAGEVEGCANKLLQTYRTVQLNWRAIFWAVLTNSTEQTRQAKHLGEAMDTVEVSTTIDKVYLWYNIC